MGTGFLSVFASLQSDNSVLRNTGRGEEERFPHAHLIVWNAIKNSSLKHIIY